MVVWWTRRAFLAAIVSPALAPPIARAQSAGKTWRVGYLEAIAPGVTASTWRDAFLRGLSDLGYRNGKNVVVEWRSAEGRLDRLPDLAAELVRQKVDVIVSGGTNATSAAAKATPTVPIVFAAVNGPVELRLITSLARPGGNITGLTFDATGETISKRLELLKEVAPKVTRVSLIVNPNNPYVSHYLHAVAIGAQAFRLDLQRVDVRTPEDFDGAFLEILRLRPDALLVQPDVLIVSQRSRVVEFAASHRLPAMYGAREFVDIGGLLSYAPNVPEIFYRAAIYVDRILKGAKPGELPVEQPRKFDVAINVKTARALGLTIQQSLLLRADHIIE